jgi:GH15 family glucan-1,4-alpha-glucosidase
MPLRIEDYGLIGDMHTAALVGIDGSIDWLCLPRFDSSACFANLLGTEENGRWRIAPAGNVVAATRRYRPSTLVLETEFETADGVVRIIDCMALRVSHPRIVRVVEGMRGTVPMCVRLNPRFDCLLGRPAAADVACDSADHRGDGALPVRRAIIASVSCCVSLGIWRMSITSVGLKAQIRAWIQGTTARKPIQPMR